MSKTRQYIKMIFYEVIFVEEGRYIPFRLTFNYSPMFNSSEQVSTESSDNYYI